MKLLRIWLLVALGSLSSIWAVAAEEASQDDAKPAAVEETDEGGADAVKKQGEKENAGEEEKDEIDSEDEGTQEKEAQEKDASEKDGEIRKEGEPSEPQTNPRRNPRRTGQAGANRRMPSLGEGKDDDYYEFYKTLADTIDQVERNYVKPVDRRELMEAAIRGVVQKLDPYSGYISPDQMQGFRTTVESQFGGIGIQVTMDNGQLKVSSPLVGTPAYKAGIQSGDRILQIDGDATKDITLDDAVRKLKGEIGTKVTLTVQHALTGRTETLTIERQQIHVDTVLGGFRAEDDSWEYLYDAENKIGYIRLTAFSRDTASELRKAMQSLEGHKIRGLILDLRFNPGGLLSSAIEVSDLFLSEGRIVSTSGRNVRERVWNAVKPGTFDGFPMVVLVNRYSASASEIVAACLQDHKRAVIIGERTWGKGSVQNVVELEAGKSALKLTTASYARPSGHNIHRFPDAKESDEWGVKPNDGFEVRLSANEMSRLLAHRRQLDIVEARLPKEEAEKPADEKSADGKSTDEDSTKSDDPESDPADEDETMSDMKPGEDQPGRDSEDKATDEKPADESKSDELESEEKPESEDAPSSQLRSGRSARANPGGRTFVDRQLQKALDYLTAELAKAGE